jgi:predicted amidophosphoribosyltransferase
MSVSAALNWLAQWSRPTLNLALPPICAGCEGDTELSDGLPLCRNCRDVFTMQGEAICNRCSAPAPQAAISSAGCLHCRAEKFRFDRTAALGVYQDRLVPFVLRMKHATGESLALAAGRLLGRQIRSYAWPEPIDFVTAVPMHWTRRLIRSTNDAAVLAEAVSQELAIPLMLEVLRATRNVKRQSSLTAARRRHNVRGVFAASHRFDIRDTHILVVDDVLTTGATANAITLALKRAGARTVSVGVVARVIGVA